jgi:adenine-specific DNA-methyltransferase
MAVRPVVTTTGNIGAFAHDSLLLGSGEGLLERVEFYRLDATRKLDPSLRSDLGQFLTPLPVAGFMASLFEPRRGHVRLLDAGAGVGSLTAAFVAAACRWEERPREISVTAYEIDPLLTDYLQSTLESCSAECARAGVKFSGRILGEDFIESGVHALSAGLLAPPQSYEYAILNPPYRKINTGSAARRLLSRIGLETSNLYAGFLSVAAGLLEEGGELVAVTPRSFCNGPYFKPFRKAFLGEMTFRRLHVFETRDRAFGDDEVLQENVVFRATKGLDPSAPVIVSSSPGPGDEDVTLREVAQHQLVNPGDPDLFIHIVADGLGQGVAERMKAFDSALEDLGLSVSTGRVVDFRAKSYLRDEAGEDTVPLIYPVHLAGGFVKWPKEGGRKPKAIVATPETDDLMVGAGHYVLVKRFSAKEERRRVVAAVYDPMHIPAPKVGFENHLNYFHGRGAGLDPLLAKGLAIYLNSSLVDSYFRQFNGHTQVNATDLRSLKYPARDQLEALGAQVTDAFPGQEEIDSLVEGLFTHMSQETNQPDPVRAKRRIGEARSVLAELGLPRAQQNERSALTLLALLDLRPEMSWADSGSPLRGITQMMDFFAEHYGKRYAPNSRETVRRFSVHQFLDAGIVIANPDDPERPINSGKTVYQVEAGALGLLRKYGTGEWEAALAGFLSSVGTLREQYAQERRMNRIPVEVAPGQTITLSPGGQNVLVEKIIDEFCPRFTPGGRMIYVGDTDEKWAHFDREALQALGVTIDAHGKMPDVVVYHIEKNWLVLIEAVTSHGPVNPKRRKELQALFGGSSAGLVFVTAFLDRKTMVKYLGEISWETEVWVADAPDHMIHFNGERFLGPY